MLPDFSFYSRMTYESIFFVVTHRHADLLHFIAQKESKCLELRSQLATHEAELLQCTYLVLLSLVNYQYGNPLVKRKWERIINRGFEKASSGSYSSPSTPSPTAPYLHPSPLTTSVAGSSSSGVVLDGIKEGMQGMGRFITAGLGSIAHAGIPEGNTSVSSSTRTLSPTFSGRKSSSSKFPVPLRLGSGNGHESQSSSSTSASITTAASSSTSATSLMLEQSITQVSSPPVTSTSDILNESDEFGDFEEAPTRSLNDFKEQEENREQVLMVLDTGATPTMSPNPHFKRQSYKEVEKKDTSGLDFDWDDGWTTSEALTTEVDSITNSGSQARTSSNIVQPAHTKPSKVKTPSLPGVSSIPGLASSSMSMNGTTPQSMSAWVDSVGKKWGEIRESQTLVLFFFFFFSFMILLGYYQTDIC